MPQLENTTSRQAFPFKRRAFSAFVHQYGSFREQKERKNANVHLQPPHEQLPVRMIFTSYESKFFLSFLISHWPFGCFIHLDSFLQASLESSNTWLNLLVFRINIVVDSLVDDLVAENRGINYDFSIWKRMSKKSSMIKGYLLPFGWMGKLFLHLHRTLFIFNYLQEMFRLLNFFYFLR